MSLETMMRIDGLCGLLLAHNPGQMNQENFGSQYDDGNAANRQSNATVRTLVLCTTESCTRGLICNSRSESMVSERACRRLLLGESCIGVVESLEMLESEEDCCHQWCSVCAQDEMSLQSLGLIYF